MPKKIKKKIKLDKKDIEKLAYFIFEQEGRPHGRHLDHWVQAELLLTSENLGKNFSESRQASSM